jgi:hypothetical protein
MAGVRGALRRFARLLAALLAASLGSGCRGSDAADLVVHAPLPEALLDLAESRFEADHPGADIIVVGSTEGETLAALRAGERVDVWWGARGTVLESAAHEGLVEWWEPVLLSPFVIAFNRERVGLMEAPRDWVDLFHNSLWDEVVLVDPTRDPDTAYLFAAMLVEALRDDDDLGRGFEWLVRLDRSTGAYDAGPERVLGRLRIGDALVTVLPRHVAEAARHGGAPWLHYRTPESGTPTLALGIALGTGSGRSGLAGEFVRMIGEERLSTASKLFTRWQPVSGAVDSSALPDDFELDQPVLGFPLATDTVTRELEGWMERWTLEVRGQGR